MPVAGEGPQPALGMVVGESPRKGSDRPLDGRDGKLFDTVLRACGIDRKMLYITNVVKETPLTEDGLIRRPTDEEIADWVPILDGEIAKTAPSVILALGRTAAHVLLDRLYEVHGEIPFGSVVGKVVVAWHPATVYEQKIDFHDWVKQFDPFEIMLLDAEAKL